MLDYVRTVVDNSICTTISAIYVTLKSSSGNIIGQSDARYAVSVVAASRSNVVLGTAMIAWTE